MNDKQKQRGGSDIVQAIQHLRMAFDHFESFLREHPTAIAYQLIKTYTKKIEWIVNDLKTRPSMPLAVRDGINREWRSDCFAIMAITEKVALLNDEQRTIIENIVEDVLAGNELNIVIKPNE